jgi:protein-disulfide isomerase
MIRRNILIGAGSLALLFGSGALRSAWALDPARLQLAEAVEIGPDERVIGDPAAPVTIVEYASMTCPHCASFHDVVYPGLKENWIDTGKARMVFRHFPLDGLALRASALAECMEGVRFFGFLSLLFETQASWARADDPVKALQELAKQAGLDEAASDACLNDDAVLTKVLEQRKEGSDIYGISSTPSFLVNGEKMQGAATYEEFDAQLKKLVGDG